MKKIFVTLILAISNIIAFADNANIDESTIINIATSATASPQTESSTKSNITTTTLNNNQPKTQLMNKIVAYVNKRIITQNELNNQITQTRNSLQQQGIKNSDEKDLQNRVLDQMIIQQIQLDLAARSGIKTTDAEINQSIENMKKTQHLTDQQLQSHLAAQGATIAQLRQQISDQITAEKLRGREVEGKVFVNDDEVNRVINSEAYKNRIDYHLSNIMISIPEQATQEIVLQKQALANQAYQQLQQGQAFEKVALKYSNSQNAISGGDLGWKSNTSLPPYILDPVKATPVGSYTQVLKLPIGFFIFKVTGIKQHGTPQIVRQYHVRHILVKVNELTSDDEAHQKITRIYDQLAKDKGNPSAESADFTNLAKQSSDDPGSAIKGGDIGWVSKGDTVPQFEQAILTTPVGQISQPVRSPFGWHILQVMEVRDSNMADEKERADIRQELRETKSQILNTEWLRNLRETAYVKINDN